MKSLGFDCRRLVMTLIEYILKKDDLIKQMGEHKYYLLLLELRQQYLDSSDKGKKNAST